MTILLQGGYNLHYNYNPYQTNSIDCYPQRFLVIEDCMMSLEQFQDGSLLAGCKFGSQKPDQ